MAEYDGVVLAGGRGRRMGTPGKPWLRVGDQPMLAASIAALAGAVQVTVVGPGGDIVERPPGGGPVAALAAALDRGQAPVTVVLAADLPFVTVGCVERLVAAAPAVACDDEGRSQLLLAAYLTAELRAAMPARPAGVPLRSVLGRLATPPALIDVTCDGPPPWWDCDTPEQLEAARRLM